MCKQERITQQEEVLSEVSQRYEAGEATQSEIDEAKEKLKRIIDSKE